MIMRKILFLTALIGMIVSTACVNEDAQIHSQGEGRLVIKPEFKSDVKVISRAAADDEEYLKESTILWISNSKGVVRKYHGLTSIPDQEWLLADKYLAEAWAGDSVSASFDKKWFKGKAEFDIKAGEATNVTLTCKIANVLVEVEYEDGVYELMDQPKFTVSHKRGQLEFTGANPEIGYFMMPSTDNNLKWSFDAINGEGESFHMEDIIENVKPATKYVLKVKASSEDKQIGGTFFTIAVDTKEVIVPEEFAIELAPIIDGYNFNASVDQVFQPGAIGHKSIVINASAELVEAKLSVAGLSDLLGISSKNFDFVDFIGADQALLDDIGEHGIKSFYDYNQETHESSLKINFEEEFTDHLPVGTYEFTYFARDSKDRTSELTSIVRISNAPLHLTQANSPEEQYLIWPTKATLSATVMRRDYGNAEFQYRQQGEENWISVPAIVQQRADIVAGETRIYAEITGLTPGTTYEYRIVTDYDNYESETLTFATESALQLPNSGFEEWNVSSTPFLIYANGGQMFWDSGNHGSATLSKNITTPDESIYHSGSKSIKLASEKIVIKFAAGNAFIGKYLETDGTDGVLGWGRPFTSRPKALKGYVKYIPQAVTDANGGDLNKGDMDQGIIYIAILDGTTKSYNGESWPVIIKTKKAVRTLFSKNDANVIAYGEKVFTEATTGDGMIEFEIPLEYFKTDVKAANIMVTMSASRYGDYFTGGPSTMWVDDLELVY